jgi:hypothetical protein
MRDVFISRSVLKGYVYKDSSPQFCYVVATGI